MSIKIPKITYDELVALFVKQDWRTEKNPPNMEPGCKKLFWLAVRRAGADQPCDAAGHPVCLTNDKLSIQAEIHELQMPGDNQWYRTVEISLTGEAAPNLWVKLAAYSVRWDDVPTQLEIIQKGLLAAWDGFCTATRTTPRCACQLEAGDSPCPLHGEDSE